MNPYFIFHLAKKDLIPFFLEKDTNKYFPRKYVHTVYASSFEEAFQLSNHIDNEHASNYPSTLRSTSIGDAIMDSRGVTLLVSSVGFKTLKPELSDYVIQENYIIKNPNYL